MAPALVNIAKPALSNPKVLQSTINPLSSISAGMGSGTGAGPVRENLNSAFQMIYIIAMILAIVIYLVVVILGVINLIMYVANQIEQSTQIKKDKYMLNKNSNEFELLQYLTNNESNDPYYIYTQRAMIGVIYSIIGAVIIVFAIHIAIYLGLRIWAILQSNTYKDTLDIPYRVMGILIFLLVIAFSLDAIYKSLFLKKFQEHLNDSQETYVLVKRTFYSNATDDVRFLNLLRSDDVKGLGTYLKGVVATDDTTSIARRFFTMSIYSYFRYDIPDTDPAYDQVLKIFTRQGITSEDINPADYLFFNKANYVSNVYPIVRDQLGLGTILGENREYQVQVELNRMLRDFNRKINTLSNIYKANRSLFNYIITIFFISLFGMFILGLFFAKEIGAIAVKVIDFIKQLRQ